MFTLNDYVEGKLTGLYIGLAVGGLIVAVILGFVSRNIVKNKNYPDASNHGFAWGFWLGIIGCLMVCALPDKLARPAAAEAYSRPAARSKEPDETEAALRF